jgi:hypothetical protein
LAMPAWANGTAESRDVCMRNFSAAWGRLLKEAPFERLERAWEFERAASRVGMLLQRCRLHRRTARDVVQSLISAEMNT